MEISLEAIQASSARLKDLGIDHIILADGRFLIEASRESSRAANRIWRKSPRYKQYKEMQKKYKNKIGIEGGYTLRFSKTKNKYVLVPLAKIENGKAALMARRKGQWTSPMMQSKKVKEMSKKPAAKSGRAARD